jgi:putative Ca2+/H+ antiporter (TMEM165/GDT1 family)
MRRKRLKIKLENIHQLSTIVSNLKYNIKPNLLAEQKKKKSWRTKNEYVMFGFLLVCEEWGDKSQFTAIALAANYGVQPIIVGGCIVIIVISIYSIIRLYPFVY